MAHPNNRPSVARTGPSVTQPGPSLFKWWSIDFLFGVVLLSTVVAGAGGCASSAGPAEISVEGTVTTRGNEPFTAYILETEDQNAYVLVFDEAVPEGIQTPVRMRVEGLVYGDTWQGQPHAHLRVRSYEPLS